MRAASLRSFCQIEESMPELIDEYKFLVHSKIISHRPTLYQRELPSPRRHGGDALPAHALIQSTGVAASGQTTRTPHGSSHGLSAV